MSERNWPEFWWKEITGASEFVQRIADSLTDSKTTILQMPEDLPWRHQLRSIVQERFRDQSSDYDMLFKAIDEEELNTSGVEPGRFLLNAFAGSAVKMGYREKSNKTIQQYLIERGVLKNKIVWVKGIKGKAVRKWVDFSMGFSSPSPSDGLIIIEVPDSMRIEPTPGLEVFRYTSFISLFDVKTMNNLIVSSDERYSNTWKQYIAALCSNLCRIDVEVSEKLISTMDFTKDNATDALRCLVDDTDLSKRGRGEDDEHILYLVRNDDDGQIENRIWKAQVEILFPQIELMRAKIIDKLADKLETVLENNDIKQFEEPVYDVKDIELGTLVYIMALRAKDNQNQYAFYLPDDHMRNLIHMLHFCRNSLAHASSLSVERVRELIEESDSDFQ